MEKSELIQRQLDEQWAAKAEDGKMHMYKAVEPCTPMSCARCDVDDGSVCCSYQNECGCKTSPSFIIKDLGILNDDGLLPCPFCGEYPKIIHPTENMPVVSIVHTGVGHRILLEFFSSEQEAKDAWNRRA